MNRKPMPQPLPIRSQHTLTRRHRRQVALQIGLPLAVGALLVGALVVAAAQNPATTAQGGSAAVILLTGLCLLSGLPVLGGIVAIVVLLHNARPAVQQNARRLQRTLDRFEHRTRRLNDRAVAPWLTLAATWAGLQRLLRRSSSRDPSSGRTL